MATINKTLNSVKKLKDFVKDIHSENEEEILTKIDEDINKIFIKYHQN